MASRLGGGARAALALAVAFSASLAAAQPAACPEPTGIHAADLHGLWQARFDDGGPGATLLLEANPNWPGSLSGGINRQGERAQLAGDLDRGELTLEESADGRRIDAAWIGALVPGSCGRQVRGTWKADGASTGRSFVLSRL